MVSWPHLTGPRKAIFANIIKIITKFIKNIFKDSQEVKIIRNNLSIKSNLSISVFIDIAKFDDF